MNTRRALLTAAGVAPLLRPFVRPALAQPNAAPKRVIFVYSANGTVPRNFHPDDPSDPTQKPILQPLARHRQDVIAIRGLGYAGYNTPHEMGTMKALTNVDVFEVRDKSLQPIRGKMYGPSIDTVLAKSVGATSLRPVVRVGRPWGNERGYLMFDESGQVLSPIDDPVKAFEFVFGAGVGVGGAASMPDPAAEKRLAAMRAARRSTLDLLRADVGVLQRRLPMSQRSKMDQALQSIQELEKGLTAQTGKPLAQCAGQAMPFPSLRGEARHKAEADLIAATLACDVSRVVVWKLMGAADDPTGPYPNFHNTSHKGGAEAEATLTEIHSYLAGRISYLVERLKVAMDPMGGGTVFANTVILWCNEVGAANHNPSNLPLVVVGSAGGYFKTGRAVVVAADERQKYGNLLVSLANAVGDPMQTFGDKRWSTGPLTGLRG